MSFSTSSQHIFRGMDNFIGNFKNTRIIGDLLNKQNIFYPLFRVVIWMETFHPNGLIKTFLLIWEEKKMITLDEHILEKK